ncbi:MAG TPA: 2-oxo acid dehydrogenase subunit E2 [Actinocrinis sp.]|nr:2-oxo acid dehydrogenase subunit E2 [Actinocrinis sp.]
MSTEAPTTGTTVAAFPAARKGTYTFLKDARGTAHVYLMTDVDATRIKQARKDAGSKISYVSYVVKAAAQVIASSPEARGVLRPGLRLKVATVGDVHAKVLFDKRTADGQRCVVSGTVFRAEQAGVEEIQQIIDTYKNADLDDPKGPWAQLAKVQRLPLPVARLAYRAVTRKPERRTALQGVFSVTSVGQEPVRAIFPMINGALGFGVGRIVDTPVVRGGEIAVAPLFTLSLAFDHRLLDGAQAAELLAATKAALENWGSE